MKILLFSDWHTGITKQSEIYRTLQKMKEENPDIIINAGDNNGGTNGFVATKRIANWVREAFPHTPILWTNGNHDYWTAENCSLALFLKNMQDIQDLLKEKNIHYLDKDGAFSLGNVIIFGSSGWYSNPNPPTNDKNWLPYGIEGDTNRYLLKNTEADMLRNLDSALSIKTEKDTLVFVSHFPVIKDPLGSDDWKGSFEDFSWSVSVGEHLKSAGVEYFLNGHAHQLHKGPLRYEAGSDYYQPKYIVIDIKDKV